eukprot:712222_1
MTSISFALFVLSLFCYKLSISHETPNCDWIITPDDLQAKEPVGICIGLSGSSWIWEIINTNRAIIKQYNNEKCSGDFNSIAYNTTIVESNLNTGFLCETYAFTLELICTMFDGSGTIVYPPSLPGFGLFNNCNAFFGDVFYEILECNPNTPSITWKFYEDDKCEILIPPDEYFPYYITSPEKNQCHEANYTSTFTIGDNALHWVFSSQAYYQNIADDIMCTKMKPYKKSKRDKKVKKGKKHKKDKKK